MRSRFVFFRRNLWLVFALVMSATAAVTRAAAQTNVTMTTWTDNAPSASPKESGAGILEELRGFRQMGSVLYVAAHPDDENTQLITYLARGRNYRTAYLSVTRGDGGQNVLGPEIESELGVIRTQELLAARRLDGGKQFFTRAIDFGFSKDYRETLSIWDKQQVIEDIVRVIRTFRPDVIITRFSPQPGGTHGHHTASAVLAEEAFKLCGDPKSFPEQLTKLQPWQPKRILQNGGGFFRGNDNQTNALRINTDGKDPVTGESFNEIAGRSRSMHKTQGFGNFAGFGGRGGGGRAETFTLLGGEPASNDIMDGVDTTWARIPGGAEIGKLAEELIAKFDPNDPAASVPALLAIRSRLIALPKQPLVEEKGRRLDSILQSCLGLEVQTTIPEAEVVPGEHMRLRHQVTLHSKIPVRWLGVRYPSVSREVKKSIELRTDEPMTLETSQLLPEKTPLSQPYWLREEPSTGMFRVADKDLIGMPENPPVFPVEQVFEVSGQTLVVRDQPYQIEAGASENQKRRRLDAIPPVTLTFTSEVNLFSPGSKRPVEVEVTSYRKDTDGNLDLELPSGWSATPSSQAFKLAKPGEHARFTFTVSAPAQATRAKITARATVHGRQFENDRIEIKYPHIPVQLLQPPAQTRVLALDLSVHAHQVGYLPGAGDKVEESLEDMGCKVTELSGADLTAEKLRGLDAVVIGVRAFNVREDLAGHMNALFDYVQNGGTVVAQYNRPNGLKTEQLAPFELRISNDRVTDETAPMTLLAPEHPAFNTPNKITSADFDGWVQERGLYFPNRWDEHFTPLVACNDPGEEPMKGGLLVAKYGSGYFVYTGLAWFRQLPDGVPGAYRFFANLISLGK